MPGGGPRRIMGGTPVTEGARLPGRDGPPFIGPFPFIIGPFPFIIGPAPFMPGGPRGRGAEESLGGGGGCCMF